MSWTTHGYRASFWSPSIHPHVFFFLHMSSICVFFYSSVFLNTALVQWAFNIKPDRSAPIDEFAFTASANTHPLPFKVIFEPRAAKTIEGVRELMEDYGL